MTIWTTLPDPRVKPLCDVYKPKKITIATIEVVDTPGLMRSHEGNAVRLSQLREAGCMVMVIGAFSGSDPSAELKSFEEDLLLADLAIVSGRVEKLRESTRKPTKTRELEQAELANLEPVLAVLEVEGIFATRNSPRSSSRGCAPSSSSARSRSWWF